MVRGRNLVIAEGAEAALQLGENFVTVDAVHGQSQLGVEEAVLQADVVALAGDLEREVALLAGELVQGCGQADWFFWGALYGFRQELEHP